MLNKLVLFGISVVCLLLFLYIANLPGLYFLNDDNIFVPASRHLNFLYGTSFRPVSDITLFLDYLLWGTNAGGYHLTNFLLHVITTLLIYLLTRKLFAKYNDGIKKERKALVVALLFFFYPFHSEAVFWIIGRGGILGTLFGTASLLFYIKASDNRWNLIWSVLFFLTGAFAYETIWIVPVIILLITYFDIKLFPRLKKNLLQNAFLFWSFFLLYFIVRTNIIGEIGGSPYGSSVIMKFDIILWIKNYNIMIARCFLPPMQSTILLIVLYCILAVLAFLFFKRIIIKKRLSKTMAISVSGLMISFLPVLTLGVNSHNSESERFLYFSSFFAVLLLTEVIFDLTKPSYQRIIFLSLFFFAELFYLAKAAKIYQISSKIASVSMNTINSLSDSSFFYCINLPQQYKGGLIYRNGFNDAVHWLGAKHNSVIKQISQREITKPYFNYKAIFSSIKELPDSEKTLISNYPVPRQFSTSNIIVLRWTDSTLQVIK